MTPRLEAAYLQAAEQLTAFKRILYPRYTHAPHLDALDRALMQVTRYVESRGKSGLGRLIVEMPPRHSKTTTGSKLYPCWHLGRNPEHRVMLVSYGATLAEKNSRAARSFMMSPRYQAVFPGVRLAEDSRSVDSWDLADAEGGVDALGIGGGATGKGAHVLLIDDPIKNRAEAESNLYRQRLWDSFTDDLYTRLEPGGAIVLIMTRWHSDDLVSRVIKNMPGEFRRLHLPAIAQANDPLGRQEGAALWPARYPIEVLRNIRNTLGEYSWAALYDQSPTPGQGGLFKREYFEPLRLTTPPLLRMVRYWDLAMSEKTHADYTTGLLYGVDGEGHRYVLDVKHERRDWGDVTPFLAETILADGPLVSQGIEQKGYMSKAVRDLNNDSRLHGYSIFGYPADTDKFTRALPAAAKAGAGFIHLLDRHWTQSFIDEVCAFPYAEHDDQVDALSGAEAMIGDDIGGDAGDLNYNDEQDRYSLY